MALGVISGFNVTRVATTAATSVSPAHYVVARLSAGAANVTATFHDGNSTTSAETKVLELSALAASADECGFPIRLQSGYCTVKLSANTGEVFLGVR